MLDNIKTIIQQTLPDATVYVLNPEQDNVHFQALVISPSFESMTRLAQHRLIMNALKSEFETAVHALALKTFTPEDWAIKQSSYHVDKETNSDEQFPRSCHRPNKKRH